MPAPAKPKLCQIDDQGRLVFPEEVVRDLISKGFKAAILSEGAGGFRLEFYQDRDAARAIVFALEDMARHPEVYEALSKG